MKIALLIGCLLLNLLQPAAAQTRPPNVVIFFADDMAYNDPACFGSRVNDTPHLDRMAKEGIRFTSFYVAAPVCSASRAALLTGCYPPRVGITGVLDHRSNIGLHPDEVTFADLAKRKDYATAVYGKWHVGHHSEFLPGRQGFDHFFGTPYSHDMWPFHPHSRAYPDLPLIDGQTTVQLNPNPGLLTKACTDRAVKFIEANAARPFLLYVPFNLPHVPLGVSPAFKGKSRNGLYGDVMMEIDDSVGRVLATLRDRGIDKETLVIFTSDNGPWEPYGNHAGSKEPLRGAKGSTWEGGMRVPMIAWWPGRIPAGAVCDELAATIDVVPTVARLLGEELPKDRVIDGRDIWPLLSGQAGAKSPHESYFYFLNNTVQAVRSGEWKLKVQVIEKAGEPVQVRPVALYNLKSDIAEADDQSAAKKELVADLAQRTQRFVTELRQTTREVGRTK